MIEGSSNDNFNFMNNQGIRAVDPMIAISLEKKSNNAHFGVLF